MKPTTMDKLDFVSSLVLTLFGVAVLVESLRLPRLENLNVNAFTVPGIVPGFLGALLTICGLTVFIRSARRGGWRLGLTGEKTAAWAQSSAVKNSLLTLVLTLVFALVLFPFVPFNFAAPMFIFVFVVTAESMALGRLPRIRAILSALVLAVVAGVIIGYVFQNMFFVRLPGG